MNAGHRVAAAALGVLSLGVGATAEAFVRTRTKAGVAIEWPRRCVPFHINNRGSDNVRMSAIQPAVRKSFAAWEQVDCSDVELSWQGETNVEFVGYKTDARNVNMVVFQEDEWPHQSKIIALTTVTFCSEPSGAPCDAAGKVLDADIEMNGVDFTFSATPVPGLVQYDVQNTVTHEVGHFLGLDHSSVADATMFATAPAGERNKQSLAQDDRDGLCSIYPHKAPVAACEAFEVEGDYLVSDPLLGTEQGDSGGGGDDGCRAAPLGAGPGTWMVGTLLALALKRRRR